MNKPALLKALVGLLIAFLSGFAPQSDLILLMAVPAIGLAVWAIHDVDRQRTREGPLASRVSLSNFVALAAIVISVGMLLHGPRMPEVREAVMRRRVSQAKQDFVVIAGALAAFHQKTANYPQALSPYLTTPIAYLTSMPDDPFYRKSPTQYGYFRVGAGWVLFSVGPDKTGQCDVLATQDDLSSASVATRCLPLTFDPTNGTESSGDVIRLSKELNRADFEAGPATSPKRKTVHH